MTWHLWSVHLWIFCPQQEKDYLSFPEVEDQQDRGDNSVITGHMTYCLLGLAPHSDLCIHPGGEISMSGMIIAGPCVCACMCVFVCVCVHFWSEKSLNPLNRCLQNNLQQFSILSDIILTEYLHLILSGKRLLFIIYESRA